MRGPGLSRGGPGRCHGWGQVSVGGPGDAREGPGEVQRFWAKNTKKPEKCSGTVCLAYYTQQHPGFCAGGSSRPNGSGYPLSVPAVVHPLFANKKRGRLNLPSVQHATQGWRICIYIFDSCRYAETLSNTENVNLEPEYMLISSACIPGESTA